MKIVAENHWDWQALPPPHLILSRWNLFSGTMSQMKWKARVSNTSGQASKAHCGYISRGKGDGDEGHVIILKTVLFRSLNAFPFEVCQPELIPIILCSAGHPYPAAPGHSVPFYTKWRKCFPLEFNSVTDRLFSSSNIVVGVVYFVIDFLPSPYEHTYASVPGCVPTTRDVDCTYMCGVDMVVIESI